MKIIIKAWAVIILLKIWPYLSLIEVRNCIPLEDNSNLIIIDNPVPIKAAINPKIKYKIAISLALVEQSHLKDFTIRKEKTNFYQTGGFRQNTEFERNKNKY